MSDPSAALLARWLEAPAPSEPPEGLEPEVVEAVRVLSPDRVPSAVLDVDALLGSLRAGPLAQGPAAGLGAPRDGWTPEALPSAADLAEDDDLEAISDEERAEAEAFAAALGGPGRGLEGLIAAASPAAPPAPTVDVGALLGALREGPLRAEAPVSRAPALQLVAGGGGRTVVAAAATPRRWQGWGAGLGALAVAAAAAFVVLPVRLNAPADQSVASAPLEEQAAQPPSVEQALEEARAKRAPADAPMVAEAEAFGSAGDAEAAADSVAPALDAGLPAGAPLAAQASKGASSEALPAAPLGGAGAARGGGPPTVQLGAAAPAWDAPSAPAPSQQDSSRKDSRKDPSRKDASLEDPSPEVASRGASGRAYSSREEVGGGAAEDLQAVGRSGDRPEAKKESANQAASWGSGGAPAVAPPPPPAPSPASKPAPVSRGTAASAAPAARPAKSAPVAVADDEAAGGEAQAQRRAEPSVPDSLGASPAPVGAARPRDERAEKRLERTPSSRDARPAPAQGAAPRAEADLAAEPAEALAVNEAAPIAELDQAEGTGPGTAEPRPAPGTTARLRQDHPELEPTWSRASEALARGDRAAFQSALRPLISHADPNVGADAALRLSREALRRGVLGEARSFAQQGLARGAAARSLQGQLRALLAEVERRAGDPEAAERAAPADPVSNGGG